MVVAVARVRVVQVTRDEVVGVVAVRDGFVAAAGAVSVSLVVRSAGVAGGAGRGVRAADGDGVLVGVVAMHVVQVPIVEVVGVPVVLDGNVSAARAVGVRMLVVRLMGHRGVLCFFRTRGGGESSFSVTCAIPARTRSTT